MKLLNHFLLLFITAIVFSCAGENAATSTVDQIVGRWEIKEASRNGRITESLAELYFDFANDGKLQTNLSGVTETGTYEIAEELLLQRGTKIDADYNIEAISDTLLVLTTELRNSAFKFKLIPVIDEE